MYLPVLPLLSGGGWVRTASVGWGMGSNREILCLFSRFAVLTIIVSDFQPTCFAAQWHVLGVWQDLFWTTGDRFRINSYCGRLLQRNR